VKVSVSGWKGSKGGTMPAEISSAHFVRYVMTDEFGEGCGHRKPEDYASSLSADMLDNLSTFNLEAKKARPVWVTVRIPQNAAAGDYCATVRIEGKGIKAQDLNLTLKVLDAQLPKPTE